MGVQFKVEIKGPTPQQWIDRQLRLILAFTSGSPALVRKILQILIRHFDRRFSSYQPTEQALARAEWDFLKDLPRLRLTYISSLIVEEVGPGQWGLAVNEQVLKEAGYPADLPDLLEYGNPLGLPACPHWRPLQSEIDNGLIDRMVEHG